ncbi:MAG: HpcH/HpaI aldolase/citrate lyase family protein [Anaerolineae bacterium]
MKPNRFKQVLAEGKVPIGHMLLEFVTPGIPFMLEEAGVDFVLIDMEHTRFTLADIANVLAWFKATTVAPFVRVPQLQYHFIARTLDAGALGVMVPDIENAAEARAIVDAAKYAPMGKRGVALRTANTDFKPVNPVEFMKYANENTTVIAMIESQEGLDNLDEIAATPGVDALWVGHFDLSQSLGIVSQFQHPKLVEALKLIAATAKKHGKVAVMQPANLAQAREWLDYGFNVMSCAADFFFYIDALKQYVADVRKLAEGQ